MIEFDLGRSRRVRVWLEPLEQAHYEPNGTLTRTVLAPRESVAPGSRCACVELVVPRGARVDYGLLGACFTPRPDHEDVTVRVDYVEDAFGIGPEFDSWIAVPPESPVVGLPKELTDSVAMGAVEEVTADWAGGPGELRFSYAAHGAYGSGGRVFSLLARLVVIVLRAPSTEATDLEQLLATAISA